MRHDLEFADPPHPPISSIKSDIQNECPLLIEDEPIVPLENPPKTLMQWGVLILNTPNPTLKVSNSVTKSYNSFTHIYR
jgi:hypothetical protein